MDNMGMASDASERITLARVDDDDRRSRISLARNAIYQRNYSIKSDLVEESLLADSLVPNQVHNFPWTLVDVR